MRINNIFSHHKAQHKYTFENSRGQRSTIDYILSNRNIHSAQIRDTRTLNSANINSDIYIDGKNWTEITPKKKQQNKQTRIKTECRIPVARLYKNSLPTKTTRNYRTKSNRWERWCQCLKTNIEEAACEVIGKRNINLDTRDNRTPWFANKIRKKWNEKKKSYLQFRARNKLTHRIS